MVAKTECKANRSYLGAKTLEETIARAAGTDSHPHRVHAARTVTRVRITALVLVNSAIGPTANVMYAKKRAFLSSG